MPDVPADNLVPSFLAGWDVLGIGLSERVARMRPGETVAVVGGIRFSALRGLERVDPAFEAAGFSEHQIRSWNVFVSSETPWYAEIERDARGLWRRVGP